ncbi:hypothetical protein CR956_00505 [Candidatus Saccharibacteria bacterium]|nr:MAG: hypothetical protein CR956_00505 [Candidatus Saccharibacteria bacterium]
MTNEDIDNPKKKARLYRKQRNVILAGLDLTPDRPDLDLATRKDIFDDVSERLNDQLDFPLRDSILSLDSILDMAKIKATLPVYESIMLGVTPDIDSMRQVHIGMVDLLNDYKRSMMSKLSSSEKRLYGKRIKNKAFPRYQEEEIIVASLLSRLCLGDMFPRFAFDNEESNSNTQYGDCNHDISVNTPYGIIPVQVKAGDSGRRYAEGVVSVYISQIVGLDSESIGMSSNYRFGDDISAYADLLTVDSNLGGREVIVDGREVRNISKMLFKEVNQNISEEELTTLNKMSSFVVNEILEQSVIR